MKFKSCSPVFFTLLLLGAALLLGGCATTGMDRSVKTSTSIREVDSEIGKMVVQLDTTAASLESLVRPGQSNLKKPFEKYSDDVVKLEKEGNRVLKRLDEMKSRSTDYFEEWEKQGIAYKNPEIRELSEERRLKLAEIYARVPAAGAGIKVAYSAYLNNLKEIKIYLSNDLTPKGVEAIAPVANNTSLDLDVLKTSLRPVVAALDEIKAELYSKKK